MPTPRPLPSLVDVQNLTSANSEHACNFHVIKIPPLNSNTTNSIPIEAGGVTAEKIYILYMSMNKDMRNRACSSGKQRKQEKEKRNAPERKTAARRRKRRSKQQAGAQSLHNRAETSGARTRAERTRRRPGQESGRGSERRRAQHRRSRYGHQGASKRHGSAASNAPRASSASGMARPAASARKRCKYGRADPGRRQRPRLRTSSSGAPMLRK